MFEFASKRTVLLAALILVAQPITGPLPVAVAQDLIAVAPEQARVEYEDARIRVVRLRIPAGATVPMHDRPRRVVISLTANDVLLTLADGTTRRTRTKAGTAAWSEPTVRSVTNLGGKLENIIIEMKQASAAAEPVLDRPANPDTMYLQEPFHQWAFENQYVRVYAVRIPPGRTTAFHLHGYDDVAIRVSGGLTSGQVQGQPWSAPGPVGPGTLSTSAFAAAPMVHRVRNHGRRDYRVIVVQFLR